MDTNENELGFTQPSLQLDVNVDWFLQMLVETVNGAEFTLPVTLNVGGLLISGEMVSGHKYFEGFAKDVKEALHVAEEVGSRVEAQINQLGDIYTQDVQGQEQGDESSKPPIQFIHLKNPKIFYPGGKPIAASRTVWWRGRLEAVDGFILGTVSFD